MADKQRAIGIILNGLTEEITVNGQVYFGEMTPQDLNDQEVADVLNFVMNSWGNNGETILETEVTKARK
jgi:nitrite reductase (NO-forming)